MNTVIIVLGAPNDAQGSLSAIATSRCEQAFIEFTKQPNAMVHCTGGFGESFNVTKKPHGFYTQQYLINKGIPEDKFLTVALSRFTFEDATLAKPILEKAQITQAVLVTSDFHMPRAKVVFNAVFPNINFSYAPAPTMLPTAELERLYAHEKNALVREFDTIALAKALP